MKYVVLIYTNPATWAGLAANEQGRVIKVHNDLIDELTASGEFLNIYRLAHGANTKAIRLQAGAPVVTDGPFGESKEISRACGRSTSRTWIVPSRSPPHWRSTGPSS